MGIRAGSAPRRPTSDQARAGEGRANINFFKAVYGLKLMGETFERETLRSMGRGMGRLIPDENDSSINNVDAGAVRRATRDLPPTPEVGASSRDDWCDLEHTCSHHMCMAS